MSDSLLLREATVQEIQLELIRRTRFNAFDGERILVANEGGASASLWKAADLSPLPDSPIKVGGIPNGACSDGLNFWVTLQNAQQLVRF